MRSCVAPLHMLRGSHWLGCADKERENSLAQTRIRDMEEELVTWEERGAELNAASNRAQEGEEEAKRRERHAEKTKEKLKVALRQMEGRFKQASALAESVKKECEEQMEKATGLEEQLKRAEAERDAANQHAREAEEEAAQCDAQIATLRRELGSASTASAQHTSELRSVQRRVEEAEQSAAEARADAGTAMERALAAETSTATAKRLQEENEERLTQVQAQLEASEAARRSAEERERVSAQRAQALEEEVSLLVKEVRALREQVRRGKDVEALDMGNFDQLMKSNLQAAATLSKFIHRFHVRIHAPLRARWRPASPPLCCRVQGEADAGMQHARGGEGRAYAAEGRSPAEEEDVRAAMAARLQSARAAGEHAWAQEGESEGEGAEGK